MIVVVIGVTAIVMSFMFKNRDWIYSLVALWAYLGIIVKRLRTEPVEIVIIAIVALCMFVIAGGIVKLIKNKM